MEDIIIRESAAALQQFLAGDRQLFNFEEVVAEAHAKTATHFQADAEIPTVGSDA